MINGIHHVSVHTPDMDRLLAFYRDVLGFEVVESSRVSWRDAPEIDALTGLRDTAAKVVMVRAANVYLEFFEYQSPPARYADRLLPSDHGFTHICLDVSDIDAEYRRLSDRGMTFNAPPMLSDGGRIKTTYGRDPDGNVVELQELCSSLDMAVNNLEGFQVSSKPVASVS